MEVVKLSNEYYDELLNSSYLSEGFESVVCKLDDDNLIKMFTYLFHKLFDGFDWGNDTLELDQYSKDVYEKLEELTRRQKNIKLTQLPLGVVLYKGYYSGALIKYFKNHLPLGEFYKEKGVLVLELYRKYLECLKELMDNGVYSTDIHMGNVLVSKDTLKVEPIDLAGFHVLLKNERDLKLEDEVYAKYRAMLCGYLIRLSKDLDKSKDYKDVLGLSDSLFESEYSYEYMVWFLEELKKNNKVTEGVVRTRVMY